MVSSINIPGSVLPGRSGVEQPRDRSSNEQPATVTLKERARAVIRTPEDGINALRKRLEQQLEQRLGASRPARAGYGPDSSELPTAADVASRVLGFVQQHLQKQATAGADSERLMALLSSARAGIELGFSQAREQIDSLGLMTEKLNSDIAESFSRITKGLADLESRFGMEALPEKPVGLKDQAGLTANP